MKYVLPVHPEEVTKRLFGVLNKRTKDILEQRFGLGKSTKRMTLEAIGHKYGITRERVRQIEADGFHRIKKAPSYAELMPVFTSLEGYFEAEGRVLRETKALGSLAGHPKHENHIYFLLSLHDPFERYHESDELHDRWSYGSDAHDQARRTLDGAVSGLRQVGRPVDEAKLFEVLSASAKNILGVSPNQTVLANWADLSKLISKNYFGEWGLTEFPEIKPRGVRDLSFMVMLRSNKKPLHFGDVATQIEKLTGKKAHVQTVHNELIKDSRFVLVGRGLYALKDWGFTAGVVKDVIAEALKKAGGALSREKIISAVLKERFVKPNTIVINLENKDYFKKLADGRYSLK